ncbi:MAG: nicotinate (nicotinamide) nucleotide adenylyltransferase [Opitutaceae bacterium]
MTVLTDQPMRIALFGGAFDPVHKGHLMLARSALEQVQLDRVYFIPAAQSPLKAFLPHVSDDERIQMLHLATAGDAQLCVETFETDTGGVSYSINTVRHFQSLYPNSELYWLLGADQFQQLERWRDVEALTNAVTFLVFGRPGSVITEMGLSNLNYQLIEAPLMDVSSSYVRQLIQSGQSVADCLPHAVDAFISDKGLYTSGEK